ncbi:MAG TPA: radical SAM protein [Geobacteraceae bacterium]|nr:radical SAM protein [Geobacteraceae bacterium]
MTDFSHIAPSASAPRLLLVYPATEQLGWVRHYQLPSLGLKQVAAATPSTWEVVLADEIQDRIPYDGDFDLVGITAMTHQAVRAYEIADRFREQGKTVVLGGMHPTVMPEEALGHADAVVVGEAEPLWATLLADHLAGRLAAVYQVPLPAGSDLTIPWARRDIFNGRRYLTTQTLQASRGCPYDCPFCTVTNYFGRQFRYRSTEDMLAELSTFTDRLVVFLDDNLLGDPARAIPLLEGMAGLGIRWGGQTGLRFAEDPTLIRLVARSGCIGLFVGIEALNGPNAVLAKASTRYSQQDLIKRVQDAGILLEASFIFGFDDHDESIFEKTLRFVEEAAPCIPTFNILTPYPGTTLFHQFDREGRLLHKDWQRYNHSEVVYRPRLMSPERLYRGWIETRKAAYSWPAILPRIARHPQRLLTKFAYNVLRKAPNDRLYRNFRKAGMAGAPAGKG